jgi:trehalose synthase
MLEPVYLGRATLDDYAEAAGAEAVATVRRLAEPLRGLRVLHLNATPYGGGVAEILRSEVPLLRDLGLHAEWRLIRGDERFFTVTKSIHNGLQGGRHALPGSERDEYLRQSARNAAELDDGYDVIVVHDPQPLALRSFVRTSDARWVWRCHIDTSAPNRAIWHFLREHVAIYDAAVFTAEGFVPPDVPDVAVHIIPPAIDPLSPKNVALAPSFARRLVSWMGFDVDRPLVAQVSRFDRWKDPFGVIDAFHRARAEAPGLQLALIGSMALDDPEAWEIYRKLQVEAHGDRDVQLFTNITGVGNVEVNAVQSIADVIVQRSIREGFGLVVSEALWKGTPVVGTHAGGIPLQMAPGDGGFLVDSTDRCAERIVWLLRHPGEAEEIGRRGRERVRKRYLMTRLVADDLRLYASVVASGRATGAEDDGRRPPASDRRPPQPLG